MNMITPSNELLSYLPNANRNENRFFFTPAVTVEHRSTIKDKYSSGTDGLTLKMLANLPTVH